MADSDAGRTRVAAGLRPLAAYLSKWSLVSARAFLECRVAKRCSMTDADLLREVMNTVGQKGKLGGPVRCVVSVSMLTEGWDANTVTHILGCRAFGTRLLCEQVVGRALRRVSYEPDDKGMFQAEYAEVLGVPFDFMPANSVKDFAPPKPRTRVFADERRSAPEIRFPRVLGYRVEFPKGRLNATFVDDSRMRLGANAPIPKQTEIDPLVGLGNRLDLGELDAIRPQKGAIPKVRVTAPRSAAPQSSLAPNTTP